MSFKDTTIRTQCFQGVLGIDYTPEQAKAVGPELFKKYEYILYFMAQISRLVYCDSGILHKIIEKSLGHSNDVVNKVISHYDAKFSKEKRAPITSQEGVNGRPMESYSLFSKPGDTVVQYGTYLSSPEDMTCLVLDTTKIIPNPNSILTTNDFIIAFKGSSTVKNFKHDLYSQFSAEDLSNLLAKAGIQIDPVGKVTASFVKPLLNSWNHLIDQIRQFSQGKTDCRIFITGHSLGAAYASLFTFILALCKKYEKIPELASIKSFHLITFGSPTILSDVARNTFNNLLDEGLITLDRVVSQATGSLAPATTPVAYDIIPSIPAGFTHPGFKPLRTEWKPESKGRPYSMDYIRSTYGILDSNRHRDARTWPFEESSDLGDRAKSGDLQTIVQGLVGETPLTLAEDNKPPVELNTPPVLTQEGGLFGIGKEKKIYEDLTKTHIPNFVSVKGSIYATAYSHAEYLGMFFFGIFRKPGMKNPASGNNMAVFPLTNEGVNITYKPFTAVGDVKDVSNLSAPVSNAPLNAAPNAPSNAAPPTNVPPNAPPTNFPPTNAPHNAPSNAAPPTNVPPTNAPPNAPPTNTPIIGGRRRKHRTKKQKKQKKQSRRVRRS